MTSQNFKKIKSDVKSFRKLYLGLTDKLVGVEINDITYNKVGKNSLTSNQLNHFEFISDFENERGIDL